MVALRIGHGAQRCALSSWGPWLRRQTSTESGEMARQHQQILGKTVGEREGFEKEIYAPGPHLCVSRPLLGKVTLLCFTVIECHPVAEKSVTWDLSGQKYYRDPSMRPGEQN